MPNLRALRETLRTIRLEDRLNLLENHLGRASSTIEMFSTAPDNENTRLALLRFQIQLDNYYHFLARLGPEQNQCASQLEWIRNNSADDPLVSEAKNQIELEFSRSREQFINHTRDLEGPNLLSWIHTVRYYISRTREKAEDLQRWSDGLAYLSVSRGIVKDLCLKLESGWPALTSHAWALFNRLESELARPWSFGKGRKVLSLSSQLENSLDKLRVLATEASELQTTIATLIEKLPAEAKPNANALILEIKELKSSLNPRLRSLSKEAAEIYRTSEVKRRLKNIESERKRASIFPPDSYADWVEHISKGHEAIAGVHSLANSVMKVLPSITPLLKSLNEEQQQELISRRESLVRTLIEANLVLCDEPYSALARMNWFAVRLTAAPVKGRCTRFSEAILPDDLDVQCLACSSSSHRECLLQGKCPVCGYLIISDFEPDDSYSE